MLRRNLVEQLRATQLKLGTEAATLRAGKNVVNNDGTCTRER